MIFVCRFVVCFFKQKTAYEVRIRDWSSDVCSSDLRPRRQAATTRRCTDLCADRHHACAGDDSRIPMAAARTPAAQLPCDRRSRCLIRLRHRPCSATIVASTIRESRNEMRSEEHTSELQSLMRISYAVFCLKNKKDQYNTYETCIYV